MVHHNGVSPARQGSISACLEGCRCDCCGRTEEVATIISVWEEEGPNPSGASMSVNLCTRCAAYLIERVTGFRAVKQLASWYQARDNARNIRLTEPS
jgi:hypothetical protein